MAGHAFLYPPRCQPAVRFECQYLFDSEPFVILLCFVFCHHFTTANCPQSRVQSIKSSARVPLFLVVIRLPPPYLLSSFLPPFSLSVIGRMLPRLLTIQNIDGGLSGVLAVAGRGVSSPVLAGQFPLTGVVTHHRVTLRRRDPANRTHT